MRTMNHITNNLIWTARNASLLKKIVCEGCAVTVCISLLGCGGLKSPVKNSGNMNQIKIGVSVYYQDDVFIKSIVENLKEEAVLYEKEHEVNINFNLVDGQNSQTMQNDQVDKFIAQDYQVLCINMVDRTAASTIIDKAKAANIPVVFFNREPVSADMQRWDRAYYVGSKAEEAGSMQGDIVLEQYLRSAGSIDRNHDGKIQYVILEGEQGHQDSLIRTEYCLKPLMDMGIPLEKLANGTANWQKSQGEEKMSTWIQEFQDKIEVVFSNNDEMALGAVAAIKKSGYAGKIKVVGVDGTDAALKAVKENEMLGTVVNDAKKQAESIMDIAVLAAQNKDVSAVEGMQNNSVRIGHKIYVKDTEKETEYAD